MKCTRQPNWVKGKISDVWEVRLPLTLWTDVCKAASWRKTTKSWIVRYCLKRLVEKKEIAYLNSSPLLSEFIDRAKSELRSVNHHRHMLCLYGEDLRILIEFARALNITVSMLVRIALYWYLGRLRGKKVSQMDLFNSGLKNLQFTFSAISPAMDFHSVWHTVVFHYDSAKFIPPPRHFLNALL